MGAMPKKKHHIQLSAQEREELTSIVRKGRASAQRQRHARILLLADTGGSGGGSSDSQIGTAAHTSIPSVERVRRICVEHGLERPLERKNPERGVCRRLDVETLFRRCLPMVFSLETSSSRYSSSVTIHRIGGTPRSGSMSPSPTAGAKRNSSRCAAGRRPRGTRAGRCGCWQGGWWNWRSSSRSATRRCARCLTQVPQFIEAGSAFT